LVVPALLLVTIRKWYNVFAVKLLTFALTFTYALPVRV
jgi:hypothetical protein